MKIFWSWQSDSPRKTNKEFIRDVLDSLCSELNQGGQIEPAGRPEAESEDLDEDGRLTVDYDTQGVGGRPPIAPTILDKIGEAAVFAADITPVVKTSGGKLIPNPNVMLELGFAIAELGYDRLVLFVNTAAAVDGTKLKNLPFDLTHCKHPHTYSLAKDADDERIAEVATELKNKIRESLRLSLKAAAAAARTKSKSPNLHLLALPDKKPAFALRVTQTADTSSAKTLAQIQQETPLQPLPSVRKSSLFGDQPSVSSRLGSFGITPPISQWSRDEVARYNQDLEWYYKAWTEHLSAVEQWSLASQREVILEFCVANDGNTPATNIDIDLIFPSDIELMNEDEVLDYPEAPRAPEKRPRGPNEAFAYIVDEQPLWTSFHQTHDAFIDKTDNTVRFHRDDLKHHCESMLGRFKIRFVSQEALKSFDIRYVISKNEAGPHFQGSIHCEVLVE
jgi:hypothetical protein